jgi:DNA-binding NarL/FixJ family response regulator
MESLSVHEQGSRFLIADDHAMFAEALRLYLEKVHPVVGIASHHQSGSSRPSRGGIYLPELCQEQRSAAKRTATYSQSRHRRCA